MLYLKVILRFGNSSSLLGKVTSSSIDNLIMIERRQLGEELLIGYRVEKCYPGTYTMEY